MASNVVAVSSPGSDSITMQCCRECSGEYRFLLPDSKIVTIFCGEPPNIPYKALSYVCGMQPTALPISMRCQKCLENQIIAISSTSKFAQLMQLAGGGSSAFLDVLSVDQSSEETLMAELLVMGKIYKNAQTISVLLPSKDEQAYWMLKDLAVTAHAIVLRQHDFGFPEFTQSDPGTKSKAKEDLDTLAARFVTLLNRWSQNIKRWKYFERAWTFQEWAMAAEIEVTFENAPPKEGMINIKNVIPNACTMVCHHQMLLAKAKDNASGPPLTKGDFYILLTKDPGPLPELHAELQEREAKFLATTDLSSPMPVLRAQTEERDDWEAENLQLVGQYDWRRDRPEVLGLCAEPVTM